MDKDEMPGPEVANMSPSPTRVASTSHISMGLWFACLTTAQSVLYVSLKAATTFTRLPMLACFVQFAISLVCGALLHPLIVPQAERLPPGLPPREQWPQLAALGGIWAVGCSLLNASVAEIPAVLATIVRTLEPLTTVILGVIISGEWASMRVLGALVLIMAGVALAASGGSSKGFSVPLTGPVYIGIVLAMVSNFCFSTRPFIVRSLDRCSPRLHSGDVFRAAVAVGALILAVVMPITEGPLALSELRRLHVAGEIPACSLLLLTSGVSFSFAQLSQVVMMQQLSPVASSVVSPVCKAVVIAVCAAVAGKNLGPVESFGVVLATVGAALFAAANRADKRAKSAAAGKSTKQL